MLGQELNAAEVDDRGVLGDRAYAVLDHTDGKVASAKNPRKWPRMFEFRAGFDDPVRRGAQTPPVRITQPDGSVLSSNQTDVSESRSRVLGREVTLEAAERGRGEIVDSSFPNPWAARAEEYWPDMEGLDYRDTVTDFDLPEETFFDCAVIHVLTTATLDRLRELYPEGRFEVRRFRPNVVVETADGLKDFVENAWIGRTVRIGDQVRLAVTGLPKPSAALRPFPAPRGVLPGLTSGQDDGGCPQRRHCRISHLGLLTLQSSTRLAPAFRLVAVPTPSRPRSRKDPYRRSLVAITIGCE